MENRGEMLQILARDYLKKGKQKGFSEKELYSAVCEVINSENDGIRIDPNQKLDEEQYCKLFKEALLRNTDDPTIYPKDEVFEKGIIVMYIIHKGEYKDVNTFLEMVANRLNVSLVNARAGVVGANPYRALATILRVNGYDVWAEWSLYKVYKRLEVLEKIESKIFKQILEIETEP